MGFVNVRRFLNSRLGFLPYAAPSTEGFERISPLGAMQGGIAFYAGVGRPLRKTPFKAFGAQDQRGIRGSFLLGPFLWTSKEKDLGCRSENRLQNSRRASDTKTDESDKAS